MEARNYVVSLAVAALIFFGALGVLFRYGGPKENKIEPVHGSEEEETRNSGVKKEIQKNISPGPEIKILPETEIEAGSAVRYLDGVFQPQEILLKDEGAGCILTVYNDDKEEILVRLSPHHESGDQGFAYNPIPAGNSIIIDPRYSGFTEAKFHSHLKPAAEFMVKFNESCS